MNEKSSDLKQPPSETKPIQFAAYRGNMAICKLLINECDNNHVYDKSRETTLLYAALGGHLEVYQLFYDSAKVKNPKLEGIGNTPLYFAAAKGHLETFKMIMNKAGTDINPSENGGWTPLHAAALEGHLLICSMIMDEIQDKNPGDGAGTTPLHVAAEGGHLEAFKMIMNKAGSDFNPSNNYGWTPLHGAAKFGQREMCKFIADKIENINPEDNLGVTPLGFAARNGHLIRGCPVRSDIVPSNSGCLRTTRPSCRREETGAAALSTLQVESIGSTTVNRRKHIAVSWSLIRGDQS